jgi:hypothetical protein
MSLTLKLPGLIVPPLTPFDTNLQVDYHSLQKGVNYVVNDCNASMVIATGVEAQEYHYLKLEERKELIKKTIEFVDKRVPVAVGISHPSYQIAVELAHFAQDLGAQAVQLLAPLRAFGGEPSHQETLDYFQMVLNEIKVPFGGQVYNASSISRPAYDSLTLKFLIDNGYQNYWILWKWLNLFNNSEDSSTTLTEPVIMEVDDMRLTNPMSDFTTTFSLFGLDEFNNKIIEFKYTQAFITSLSPIEYSFQTANEIICTATFVFNQLNISLLKDINTSNC